MEDGRGDVARQPGQVLVALVGLSGFPFARPIGGEGGLADDAARHAQALCRHLAILLGAEVTRGDGRRILETRALDVHGAAAGRVEIAHAGSERRHGVQRVAERVQAQRLHMELEVGVRPVGRRTRECAQLRRGHAHRSGAPQRVLEPDQPLAPPTAGQGVERLDAAHLVDRADLEVVLQVGAHSGQIGLHRNAL